MRLWRKFVSPKFLAILAVLGIALYYVFGKSVAGGTAFTGSTAQPNSLLSSGGLVGFENALSGIFGAAGSAPAAQVQANATAGGFSTNAASVNSVAGGSATLAGVNTLEGSEENEQALLNSGYITTTGPTLSQTLEPLAPTTTTAGTAFNNQLPQGVGTAGLGTSLDATNVSIGAVAPPTTSFDASTSLDDTGFDYSTLSSLG
jgi:hypothetical protein